MGMEQNTLNAEAEAMAKIEAVRSDLKRCPEWIRQEYERMLITIEEKAHGKYAARPDKTLECLAYLEGKIAEAKRKMLPKRLRRKEEKKPRM